jgi:hypothetical protein
VTSKTVRDIGVYFTLGKTLMSDGGERKHAVCLSPILEPAAVIIGPFRQADISGPIGPWRAL